ncbi:response regulator transcription factor [Hyphococcus sp. DH-69]|uniref:response regulator transcription factor n=1 Tax=Hyphococcus formosus TaxID=3143534 RepID=UPI00398ADF5C
MVEKARPVSIFLVDDDAAVRRGVSALLTAADYSVTCFNSAETFLDELQNCDLSNAALLVDVCMPGMQGIELLSHLKSEGTELPVVVMTAHGDIPLAVRAMQSGAAYFLEKPFTAEEVTAALTRATKEIGSASNHDLSALPEVKARFDALTPREKEVIQELVEGATSKEIARRFDISPRTVEAHRKNLIAKMQAGSFAELIRMAVALGLCE